MVAQTPIGNWVHPHASLSNPSHTDVKGQLWRQRYNRMAVSEVKWSLGNQYPRVHQNDERFNHNLDTSPTIYWVSLHRTTHPWHWAQCDNVYSATIDKCNLWRTGLATILAQQSSEHLENSLLLGGICGMCGNTVTLRWRKASQHETFLQYNQSF